MRAAGQGHPPGKSQNPLSTGHWAVGANKIAIWQSCCSASTICGFNSARKNHGLINKWSENTYKSCSYACAQNQRSRRIKPVAILKPKSAQPTRSNTMIEAMFLTSLAVALAFAVAFGIVISLGYLSVKPIRPPPVNRDTERLDRLSTTKDWLIYDADHNAWAVVDIKTGHAIEQSTIRDAIDAHIGLSYDI